MDMPHFDNALVQIALAIGGAAAVLSITVHIIKTVLKKRREQRHIQFVRCSNCSWKGKVSRYAGRCPQCNEPLGDQRAKR